MSKDGNMMVDEISSMMCGWTMECNYKFKDVGTKYLEGNRGRDFDKVVDYDVDSNPPCDIEHSSC